MLSLILHAYLRLTNKGVIVQSHPNLSILKLIDRLHSFFFMFFDYFKRDS